MTTALLERYIEDGFVHLERIFPEEEIELALHAVGHLPEWIRRRRGDRNVQRIQPLQSCEAVDDPTWIGTFYDNARLNLVLDGIFGGTIQPVPRMSRDVQLTALLIEPLDRWWSTGLHRDYRDLVPDLRVDEWTRKTGDLRLFNQVNIPLLPDSSFWLIPGSHRRSDREDEARLVQSRSHCLQCRSLRMASKRIEEVRGALLEGMAECGGINLEARPGDLILYRSNMLHCGIYEPGVKRLTLHDGIYSVQWHEYVLEVVRGSSPAPGSRS